MIPEKFNAAGYFIDRHIVEGRGERVAIECGERKITYHQLFQNVNRTGNALRGLGVTRGDRILLILPDIPEFAFAFFGTIKIGAVPVPLNPYLSLEECQHVLQDSEASIVIVAEEYLAKFRIISRNASPQLAHILVIGGKSLGEHECDFIDLLAQNSSELEPALTSKDDVAFWLYSSGSTGFPKACVHLQHDMVVCSEYFAKGVLSETENDRSFSVSKLFFAYGLGNALYYPFAFGGTSILMPELPKPEKIFQILERYRPTLFYSVPSSYTALLAYAETAGIKKEIFASVRCAVSAGEALPAPLFHRFKKYFGLELVDGIGSTEALQAFISNRPGDVRPGSSGKVVPGYDAKILDDQSQPVPQGELGNLWIKNDAICSQYWNQPEKTKEAIHDGWLRTGDVYHEDADHYFWFAGRSDDMFKSNGQWVSPIEVEQVLLEHPAVLEAAVVGMDNHDALIKPFAYIVLKEGDHATPALLNELRKFAAARLPSHKQPRLIQFVSLLPKTATGKIQRFKLRENNKEVKNLFKDR